MRATRTAALFMAVALAGLFHGDMADAQTNPSHTHMGHVMDGFRGTPEGQGLLPTAKAEATVAMQHAGLAARDPGNLQAMQTHAGHVIHAIDPGEAESGPGAGYGVKPAAAGVAQHIGLAANAEGASDNVKRHAAHVTASADNTVARADQIIALAKQVQAAESAEAAALLVNQMMQLAMQLLNGNDANGDGSVGWQEGEGGLAQVEQHMNLMIAGEGGG